MWWNLSWGLLFAVCWTFLPPSVAGDEAQNQSIAFPDNRNLLAASRPSVPKPDPPMVVNPKVIGANVMPRDRKQIIYHCWGYLGHSETISDLKGFLRWGCQPSPHTCEGFRKVPRVCGDVMFSIYNWATPDHVNRLFRRCRAGPRPFTTPHDGQPQRFIPYCVDFINYLHKKYGDDGRRRGGHGQGEGHHKPPQL